MAHHDAAQTQQSLCGDGNIKEGQHHRIRCNRPLLKLSLIMVCCLYITIVFNAPIMVVQKTATFWMGSLLFAFLSTYCLLYLASFFYVSVYKIIAILVIFISCVAAYATLFFNVIIDYGMLHAAFTLEKQFAQELIDYKLLLWCFFFGVLPAIWIAYYPRFMPVRLIHHVSWLKESRRLNRIYILSGPIAFIGLIALSLTMRYAFEALEKKGQLRLASPFVVIAQTYPPTNWLLAGLVHGVDWWQKRQEAATLFNPAAYYNYQLPAYNDDTTLVLVIGESARYDHMGLYGYSRDTTPLLAKEKNVVALRGESCDTLTKSSLKCMFVRPGAIRYDPVRLRPIPQEEMVFSVFKALGFSIDLFSTQSEVDFYLKSRSDGYKFMESYAASSRNLHQFIYDDMLLPDVAKALNRRGNQPHLIILHTMGSHYEYAARYPKTFASFSQKDTLLSDKNKGLNQALVNAYDNSILYTDFFLSEIIALLRDKKALFVFTADHGESLGENGFYRHGNHPATAPFEQRAIPFIIWASDKWLANEENKEAFLRLVNNQDKIWPHQSLFASLLDCLGIYSEKGGVDLQNSWCH